MGPREYYGPMRNPKVGQLSVEVDLFVGVEMGGSDRRKPRKGRVGRIRRQPAFDRRPWARPNLDDAFDDLTQLGGGHLGKPGGAGKADQVDPGGID